MIEMKKYFGVLCFILTIGISFGQEQIFPLTDNSLLTGNPIKHRAVNNIDSTFIYLIDTIDVPVWDDFSTDKFQHYDALYTDGNVSSQWFFHLWDPTNTVDLDTALKYCDSTQTRHDTVVVTGTITDEYSYWTEFTPVTIWVHDLSAYPVLAESRTLFAECYIIIDSLIDGIPDPDTDTLYFTPQFTQDSANVFFVDVDEPGVIWIDSTAYHNYRYPVDPWSLGVATFDGLNEHGMPYDFGNPSAHEIADYLTSKPIDLTGTTDVFLTFLYQAGGYGNDPETEDSLILDYWVVDSMAWFKWWGTPGGIDTDEWDTMHLAVPVSLLDNGFRFRFRNWASTSAALDHWHIDYVTLKDNDLPTVDYFNDLAISYPINTFLEDYTAVPWDHFQNTDPDTLMVEDGSLYVYNSAANPSNYDDGTLEIEHLGILQGSSPFTLPNPGASGGWTGNWELGVNAYPYDIAALYSYDETVTTNPQTGFDIKINIDTDSPGQNLHPENDTNYYRQNFDNFYAYDDGSAEAAYGLNGAHAFLAYQFTAYELDTLTGILMHFVPFVEDLSTYQFLLTVWEDSAGVPGPIIYQDDYFETHTPDYAGSKSGFKYFEFINTVYTVVVPGEPLGRRGVPLTNRKFYVGWEQLDDESLQIGLDWNIDNSNKIYRNTSGSWVTSSFDCSLLIRPVFSTGLNYTLETEMEEEVAEIVMFPNPSSDIIQFRGLTENFRINIFDMSGRVVESKTSHSLLSVADLQSGVYVVRITDSENKPIFTEKLIVR